MMLLVIAVSSDRYTRETLRAAFSARVHLRLCNRADDLVVRIPRRVGAVLIDLVDQGPAAVRLLHNVRSLARPVPVLGLVRPPLWDVRLLFEVARAGLNDVALLGKDSLWTVLKDTVASVDQADAANDVLRLLKPIVPAAAWRIVAEGISRAPRGRSVPELARQLGITERTLRRRLALTGLPGPLSILLWGRLLVATRLLEARGYTVSEVADLTGFASSEDFRRVLRRHTGLRPSQLRDKHALGVLVDRFQADMAMVESIGSSPGSVPQLVRGSVDR